MHRFRLLAAAAALSAAPFGAFAERLSLEEISAYLDGLKTAASAFVQHNADGTASSGRVWISRPGKIRFEYDPPERTTVIADGRVVAVIDGRSNTRPQIWSLHLTPLKFVLRRNVDLTRPDMAVAHEGGDGFTGVRLQDPGHPERGSVDLLFREDPVELRQWTITDATGARTTVVLEDLRAGAALDGVDFEIPGLDDQSG